VWGRVSALPTEEARSRQQLQRRQTRSKQYLILHTPLDIKQRAGILLMGTLRRQVIPSHNRLLDLTRVQLHLCTASTLVRRRMPPARTPLPRLVPTTLHLPVPTTEPLLALIQVLHQASIPLPRSVHIQVPTLAMVPGMTPFMVPCRPHLTARTLVHHKRHFRAMAMDPRLTATAHHLLGKDMSPVGTTRRHPSHLGRLQQAATTRFMATHPRLPRARWVVDRHHRRILAVCKPLLLQHRCHRFLRVHLQLECSYFAMCVSRPIRACKNVALVCAHRMRRNGVFCVRCWRFVSLVIWFSG
jgi:hypothetical protein